MTYSCDVIFLCTQFLKTISHWNAESGWIGEMNEKSALLRILALKSFLVFLTFTFPAQNWKISQEWIQQLQHTLPNTLPNHLKDLLTRDLFLLLAKSANCRSISSNCSCMHFSASLSSSVILALDRFRFRPSSSRIFPAFVLGTAFPSSTTSFGSWSSSSFVEFSRDRKSVV